jgi:hypothetical protein
MLNELFYSILTKRRSLKMNKVEKIIAIAFVIAAFMMVTMNEVNMVLAFTFGGLGIAFAILSLDSFQKILYGEAVVWLFSAIAIFAPSQYANYKYIITLLAIAIAIIALRKK